VSCQDVNEGKLNAYRRMIYEDERAPAAEQVAFVLHLGDFIYEVVEYPDEVKTRYDRTIYEVARFPEDHSHKVSNFHIPLSLDGYRAVYKGYLTDPDLQDARARWPFVCIWDNHEFSWQGWQSIVKAGRFERPGQSIKVAANQAWFEYIPARVPQRNGAEGVVQREAQELYGGVENLGQLAGHAGSSRRPAEPARGSHQGVLAERRLRMHGRRRLRYRVPGARGDLRSRSRLEDYRL